MTSTHGPNHHLPRQLDKLLTEKFISLYTMSVRSIRPATHAGTWYSGNKTTLSTEIKHWLSSTSPESIGRFAVGPHAGHRFCGGVLAKTYKALDPSVERVFVMGPSHFEYFIGVRTTSYAAYDTPLGRVDVDVEITRNCDLKALSIETDQDEHSIEMHLPFLKTLFPKAKIVPLVFGDLSYGEDSTILALLKQYFSDNKTAFVVSSDFCHWGRSFRYTHLPPGAGEIWQRIQALDEQAMKTASTGSSDAWKEYIKTTGNTVCGQLPLWTLLKTGEVCGHPLNFQWLGYQQSSHVTSKTGSSVSYASGAAN